MPWHFPVQQPLPGLVFLAVLAVEAERRVYAQDLYPEADVGLGDQEFAAPGAQVGWAVEQGDLRRQRVTDGLIAGRVPHHEDFAARPEHGIEPVQVRRRDMVGRAEHQQDTVEFLVVVGVLQRALAEACDGWVFHPGLADHLGRRLDADVFGAIDADVVGDAGAAAHIERPVGRENIGHGKGGAAFLLEVGIQAVIPVRDGVVLGPWIFRRGAVDEDGILDGGTHAPVVPAVGVPGTVGNALEAGIAAQVADTLDGIVEVCLDAPGFYHRVPVRAFRHGLGKGPLGRLQPVYQRGPPLSD